MLKSITTTALFTLVAGGAFAQTSAGVVTVDSLSAEPNEQFVLDVRLSATSVNVSGLLVPLRYDGSRIEIDSVTFDGSFITSAFVASAVLDTVGDTIQISYTPFGLPSPTPYMSSPQGRIARLHGHVLPFAPVGVAVIDSVNKVPDAYNNITRVIHMSDPTGLITYFPGFNDGMVTVELSLDVEELDGILPEEFSLSQNYPNPFNPTTIIEFSIPSAGHVSLTVYNVLGQQVGRPVDKTLSAGTYQTDFDASALPSGIYFYRLESGQNTATRKMVVLK